MIEEAEPHLSSSGEGSASSFGCVMHGSPDDAAWEHIRQLQTLVSLATSGLVRAKDAAEKRQWWPACAHAGMLLTDAEMMVKSARALADECERLKPENQQPKDQPTGAEPVAAATPKGEPEQKDQS